MKIAYLSILPPPGSLANSGVHKVSESLLRAYESEDGIEVHAVSLIDDLRQPCSLRKGAVIYHYLPCVAKGKTLTLYFREVRRLQKWLESFRPDVVHGQPTAEYLLAATRGVIPAVITIHGLVMRESKGLNLFSPGFLANAIREWLQIKAIRRARNIISISPYVDEYLANKTAARIWPVANPIDPEFFHVAPVDGGSLRIICVGIVSERKNQLLLVQACRELLKRGIKFECRIIGKTQLSAVKAIRDFLADERLEGAVEICGIVSREELLEAYRWSNAVVLPSREETSPLSLIQALAAARPAFGAAAAGIPHLLDQGRYGGLFRPESALELADKLAAYSTNPDPVLSIANVAATFALKRFHPKAVADSTMSIYRSLACPDQKNLSAR